MFNGTDFLYNNWGELSLLVYIYTSGADPGLTVGGAKMNMSKTH